MTKEVEHVIKLDDRKKYEYFVKKVADFEVLWSLAEDDGFASVGEDDFLKIPLWPKKEFAELCISDEWSSYHCATIDLYDFLEEWIPNLKEDGCGVSLFWYEGAGIEVDLDDLKRDLQIELEKY